MDYIYDIECYPNIFTLAIKPALDDAEIVVFEVSEFKDERKELTEYLNTIIRAKGRMVGFNNMNYDYPVLHRFLCNAGNKELHNFSQNIITSNTRTHIIWEDKQVIPQVDLFSIHHFDDRSHSEEQGSKSCSLKALAFEFRTDKLQELPMSPLENVHKDRVDELKEYNKHDVEITYEFYKRTKGSKPEDDRIAFREEVSKEMSRNVINKSDVKLGEMYVESLLRRKGVYTKCKSPRDEVHLKDIVKVDCSYLSDEVRQELLKTVVNTKEEVGKKKPTKNVGLLSLGVNGYDTHLVKGGCHWSVRKKSFEESDGYIILDMDATSFYPNITMNYGLYPEHLGLKFLEVYKNLLQERRDSVRGSTKNKMLKLALNGLTGKMNERFSFAYDPKCYLSITINGQLLLWKLSHLLNNVGVRTIYANTDGITVLAKKESLPDIVRVTSAWELETGLNLEFARYSKMHLRDVNNYVAMFKNGRVKAIGAYNIFPQHYQKHSLLCVPRAVIRIFKDPTLSVHDALMLEFKEDQYGFFGVTKIKRGQGLFTVDKEMNPIQSDSLQRNTRYYVSKDGEQLVVIMPPLAKSPGVFRQTKIHAGYGVTVCNESIPELKETDVDFSFYESLVSKLINFEEIE